MEKLRESRDGWLPYLLGSRLSVKPENLGAAGGQTHHFGWSCRRSWSVDREEWGEVRNRD